MNRFVESYLQAIDIWNSNPAAVPFLDFDVADPIFVLKKWRSYEKNEDLCQMRNLLYRISVDFSERIGLQTAPLVVHNYDRFGEEGVCIPLENDSTLASLISLPPFEPEYADWRVPVIVSLAHEIGHSFVYQNWRSSYNLESWQRTVDVLQIPESVLDMFIDVWMKNWFHELVADLIAALLLGPAGIYWDQKEYISMRRRRNQHFNVGSRTHPPDVLRTYWKVELLSRTNTPSPVIDNLRAITRTPYEGLTLNFVGLPERYVLSQSVVNHFITMAIDWLEHFGITFDWIEIENRYRILNQGLMPPDRVGLTSCALLHVALNNQITSILETMSQQFGGPID